MQQGMMFDQPMPPQFDGFPDDPYYGVPINRKDKKDKTKNERNPTTDIVAMYDGCVLQKAPARAGEFESWARPDHEPLHSGDIELAQLSRKYRKEVGDPLDAFAQLSRDQQSAVNRYIEARQSQEDDEHAEWSLDCVYRHKRPVFVKNAWTRARPETKSITVIIKRQDRKTPSMAHTLFGRSNSFAEREIIGVNGPHKKSKDGRKDNKKQRDQDMFIPPFDDFMPPNLGPGPPRNADILNVPPPPMQATGGPRFDFPPPPPPPPAGAIHVDQFHPPQHGPSNPFEPLPHLNTPDLYESSFQPPMNVDPQFQTRRQTPILEHRRSRSLSRDRRRQSRERRKYQEQEEARRREDALRLEQEERHEEDRRQQRINQQRTERMLDEIQGNMQEQQDQMHQLTGQFAQLNHGRSRYSASSEGSQHRDQLDKVDMWSLPSGGSFTPPSSPGRRSPALPSGTLGRKFYHDQVRKIYPIERRNSSYHRDKMVVLEPYATIPRGRDAYQQSRRRDSANLEDDYPHPPAPMPPMDSGRRHRPQIHQRAATFANDDYPIQPLALPQYPAQEYAQFGAHHRRGREGRKRRDSDLYGRPREVPVAYVYADERNRRGGRRSDRTPFAI
ncbi:hypothetical protein CBER1_02819 [Cercospora berteroae]|uniref:Uncharacterized protein n=1 Tax=Cercospora berteroae TaxID=357750 RepID=A0A2S6CBX1_9PEZI|nr:hypothetical protein CBER1_02819 [Cercospora berteroae]